MEERQSSKLSVIGKWIIGSIGFISAVIGIYATIFQTNKPKLEGYILANIKVLDINADITNLDITYKNHSIKQNNQNLQIINLSIENIGNESILKSHYDENDPLRIIVVDGTIADNPQLLEASNDYIKTNLKPTISSTNTINLNQIIIDPNESFTVKLLVLHRTNTHPYLKIAGKIANQNSIIVNTDTRKPQEKFIEAFGNILTRAVPYGVLSIFSLYILLGYRQWRKKRLRRRLSKNFANIENIDKNDSFAKILRDFIENDYKNIKYLNEYLSNESDLLHNIATSISQEKLSDEDGQLSIISDRRLHSYVRLSKLEIIIKDPESSDYIINHSIKNELTKFLLYLKHSGYLK